MDELGRTYPLNVSSPHTHDNCTISAVGPNPVVSKSKYRKLQLGYGLGYGLDVMHGGEALSGITSKQLSLPDKSIPDVGPSLISDVKTCVALALFSSNRLLLNSLFHSPFFLFILSACVVIHFPGESNNLSNTFNNDSCPIFF